MLVSPLVAELAGRDALNSCLVDDDLECRSTRDEYGWCVGQQVQVCDVDAAQSSRDPLEVQSANAGVRASSAPGNPRGRASPS